MMGEQGQSEDQNVSTLLIPAWVRIRIVPFMLSTSTPLVSAIKHPFCNFYKTVALILKETMEEAGRSFLKVVPAKTEVVIVDSWAEK